ncbi:UNVERIFIED_CONTAM: hypothetical protein GTU68_047357 [Idotea baltica]|nr:hypothetical protein [Idotea baltica]
MRSQHWRSAPSSVLPTSIAVPQWGQANSRPISMR